MCQFGRYLPGLVYRKAVFNIVDLLFGFEIQMSEFSEEFGLIESSWLDSENWGRDYWPPTQPVFVL